MATRSRTMVVMKMIATKLGHARSTTRNHVDSWDALEGFLDDLGDEGADRRLSSAGPTLEPRSDPNV
ncbi:MAG: hypothetical protein JWM74_3823 [Myxococcaceae bacterium]|jgi:hypothetical protein|nr:hypothetical protein [Myxococcaceae bacterium]